MKPTTEKMKTEYEKDLKEYRPGEGMVFGIILASVMWGIMIVAYRAFM